MSADPRLDSQVAGLTADVGAVRRELEHLRTDLGREIGQLRTAISDRHESLEEALDRNTEQVRQTNGRVRDHDLQFAALSARADERERILRDQANKDTAAAKRAQQRLERRDRWLLAFAAGSFTVLLAAGVGLLVKLTGIG